MSSVAQLKAWLAELPDDAEVAVHCFIREDAEDYLKDRDGDDYVPLTDHQWGRVVKTYERSEHFEDFTDCLWWTTNE